MKCQEDERNGVGGTAGLVGVSGIRNQGVGMLHNTGQITELT